MWYILSTVFPFNELILNVLKPHIDSWNQLYLHIVVTMLHSIKLQNRWFANYNKDTIKLKLFTKIKCTIPGYIVCFHSLILIKSLTKNVFLHNSNLEVFFIDRPHRVLISISFDFTSWAFRHLCFLQTIYFILVYFHLW